MLEPKRTIDPPLRRNSVAILHAILHDEGEPLACHVGNNQARCCHLRTTPRKPHRQAARAEQNAVRREVYGHAFSRENLYRSRALLDVVGNVLRAGEGICCQLW
ncbi:hypothetical protein HRbin30_01521 [bacterium HR30]|nr:hypothetical protein HRbin30_01521 [bacterium HR30]